MPKGIFHRSIQVYLSKLKMKHDSQPQDQHHSIPTTTTTGWLLSACRHPRTPSFSVDRDHHQSRDPDDTAATLSDVDRFLFENFSSLYAPKIDDTAADNSSSGSPRYDDPPSHLRSSQRFFASPSTSNSLVEEARLSEGSSSFSAGPDVSAVVPDDSVAVTTFSKDPYDDFRRSMLEMVDARKADPRQPLDWDFLEELLSCYLDLNHRSVHGYILGAFTDLVVTYRRKFPAIRRQLPMNEGRTSWPRKEELV